MKNRASAERSRQRKQAYVEELEMKMATLISEKVILQVLANPVEFSRIIALNHMARLFVLSVTDRLNFHTYLPGPCAQPIFHRFFLICMSYAVIYPRLLRREFGSALSVYAWLGSKGLRR